MTDDERQDNSETSGGQGGSGSDAGEQSGDSVSTETQQDSQVGLREGNQGETKQDA
jgi:hypothetical protein